MDRRTLIRNLTLGGLGGAALATGCRATPSLSAAPTTAPSRVSRAPWAPASVRRLSPVRVDPGREIRTVVGLRPFRRTGFRVEAQRLDETLVVHNYGHGGGGVTLSWGSAELAVRLAGDAGDGPCAVIGAGVLGLSSALLLQERGHAVTLYARELPPATTSDVAGALWQPYMVSEPGRASSAHERQFELAARLAHARFQTLVGADYGVRWLDVYSLTPFRSAGPRRFASLYPDSRALEPHEHPFSQPYARVYTSMLIEPARYLRALMRDFRGAGGRVVVRELHDLAEIAALPERVVLNCTGLGAAALCGDSELVPVKGQLTVLLPQPEVDYAAIAGDLYMFPRSDGILLGGTHETGVDTLTPDPDAKARILAGHRRLFDGMRESV